MSTYYTIDEVKSYVAEKSKGKCELVSTEYINNSSLLDFKCSCGQRFSRTLQNFKRGAYTCRECYKKTISKKYRKSFDEVVGIIESKGCKYISGEYINNGSKLLLECSCGQTFQKSFRDFYSKGQDHCPKCGMNNLRKSKTKYSKSDAEKIVSKKGYKIIGDYVNAFTPFLCKCKNGHETTLILTQFLVGRSGCKECAILESSGQKHWNYKGGKSEILDDLRKTLKIWKQCILRSYDYKCSILGTKNDLVIHHIIPFMEIVNIACKNVGLPLKRKFDDYSENEYLKLKNEVLRLHSYNSGIPLERIIHTNFHKKYGKKNNTLEQLENFLLSEYQVDIEDVFKKQDKNKYSLTTFR